MIYITGDTHGEFERLGSKHFPGGLGDYLIVCGDFGGVWDGSHQEQYWRKWLSEKPFTTLFIDGNHENYDRLSAYPVTEWHGGKVHRIADNILHLMRGQVFEIDGVRFFTFGGASSHDIDAGILEPDDPDFVAKRKKLDRERALYRINHVSWWAEELSSEEEQEEGLRNLEKYQHQVDCILSHCAPSFIQDIVSRGFYRHDSLTDYLDRVEELCDFRVWFFGHYHANERIGKKFVLLYDKIAALADLLRDDDSVFS